MPKNYDMGERAKTSIESTVLDVWKAAADNGDSGENSYEVGTDRYRKHTEDKTPGQSAETALESNGQAQLKGLKETVLGMWKEAANSAVDPKEREELDTAPEKTAKKMKRADEPKPMVATEETEEMYDELAEKLTAKQKKIDVDGDGEIEGSDLAKLRKKAKKEGKDELELAKELKVNSKRISGRSTQVATQNDSTYMAKCFNKMIGKEDNQEFAMSRVFKYAQAGIISVLDDPTGKRPIIQYDDSTDGLIGKTIFIYVHPDPKNDKYTRILNECAPLPGEYEHMSYTEDASNGIKASVVKRYKAYMQKRIANSVPVSTSDTSDLSTDVPF